MLGRGGRGRVLKGALVKPLTLFHTIIVWKAGKTQVWSQLMLKGNTRMPLFKENEKKRRQDGH